MSFDSPYQALKEAREKFDGYKAVLADVAGVNVTGLAECAEVKTGSTNIAGFGSDFGVMKNTGWYNRESNTDGVILPQGITEFTNAGLMVGISSVNMATDPENDFNGFYTASSTYGSFSYLKYGAMRLYSQMAQDCELKLGKTIWVAGHSGPETAEDSRTHFGIFSPGVTQLFPDGHVIDIHPWDYNEVPVMLAAVGVVNRTRGWYEHRQGIVPYEECRPAAKGGD